MRSLQFWFNTFIFISQNNPPRFIEFVMLFLAMLMLVASMAFPTEKPYMILALSFVVGSALSILVREALEPTYQARVTKINAILMLIIGLYGFIDVIHNT
ncbi:MAG: hypothetical protein IGS39_22290 [Calothrix sp. C42_A2020_038]|nr:hypothetical protein [Calothrix sp. C42_A2020_038]